MHQLLYQQVMINLCVLGIADLTALNQFRYIYIYIVPFLFLSFQELHLEEVRYNFSS